MHLIEFQAIHDNEKYMAQMRFIDVDARQQLAVQNNHLRLQF